MVRFLLSVAVGLCLVIAARHSTAQIINLDNPSTIPLIREGPWRFKAGDSTRFKALDYNDRHWARISPEVALSDNPTLWQDGVGYFRKAIRFRRVGNIAVTMVIWQFGTAEVYLDGNRLALLRPTQSNAGNSQRVMAFVPLPITDTSQHQLAFRYTFRRDPIVGTSVSKTPFRLSFQKGDQAIIDMLDSHARTTGVEYLLGGLFGMLSVLHLLFFRANTTQRVHLTLSLTMLAFALIFMFENIDMTTGSLTVSSLLSITSWVTVNMALGLLLLSVYIYLGRPFGLIFWGIMLSLISLIIAQLFSRSTIEEYVTIPFLLVLTEYIRVSWVAKRRQGDPLTRLPWNSLKFSLYSILAIIVLALIGALVTDGFTDDGDRDWLTIPMILLGMCALFSIPVGLSFSLVGDYTRTYQSLRQQLEMVNHLSAKTLAQEQEKQHLLASQNEKLEQLVADRTAELNQSLVELRATQTQLVQREKLASLGELTAGIAHEIQNPLNFVNNFSEVSTELVAELREEHEKPNPDHDLEAELFVDLSQNLQKITHHGKRAAAIVKGMLEHSRSITGEKQPADLNALIDEHLRLAYQSIQTRESAFRATLITHFDPELGLISIVEQEIGRVLLNLFSNAFYALHKRQKTAEPGFEPTLQVTTARSDEGITLHIRDNGTGIPEQVQKKVFQPFFTTKPSGEGTGLGLSLSYDIITKGYGGTISLQTEENQFTQFIITLPVS